jgi:hypothetical protein
MPTPDQDKPAGKPRQRSRKADKPVPKPEQQPSPMLDQRAEDQIEPMVAAAAANNAAIPVNDYPISLQTIANAHGDYAKKSLLESRSFVERLMAARSLDKAIEVQTEFTRQTCANFIADSQKICELYREFARQTLQPLLQPWGVAARMTEAGLASWPTSQSQH